MRFENYTPHPLHIHTHTGVVVMAVNGPAPRLNVGRTELAAQCISTGDKTWDSIPIVRSEMGVPEGLPEEVAGRYLIVSALVAEHPSVASRCDLFYPGEAVRDSEGKIVGCKGLCAGPGAAFDRAREIRNAEGETQKRCNNCGYCWNPLGVCDGSMHKPRGVVLS